MYNIVIKYWKLTVLFFIGIFLGLMINLPSCSKLNPTVIEIPVHDTVMIESVRIEEKTKIKYENKIDTFYIDRIKRDTVYLKDLPIEYKTYKDTVKTDSTSTEISIDYHGFSSGIDNVSLINSYIRKDYIVPEQKKNLTPFIFLNIGPTFDSNFKNLNGITVGAGAGLYFKNNWGVGASYDINVTKLEHTVKAQVYKKF